jgi:hypothetical protein
VQEHLQHTKQLVHAMIQSDPGIALLLPGLFFGGLLGASHLIDCRGFFREGQRNVQLQHAWADAFAPRIITASAVVPVFPGHDEFPLDHTLAIAPSS